MVGKARSVVIAEGVTVSGASTNVGGGGEKNFYDNGDADNVADTSNESTGNNATFDGGGTLVGAYTISTTAADTIDGTNTRLYTMHASTGSANDYVASETIDIDLGFRGQMIGIKFRYKYNGADDDLKFVVKDTTNATILTDGTELIKAADHFSIGGSGEFIFPIFVPATCAQLEIGPQILVHNSSKKFVWDNVVVTPDPFIYRNEANLTEWKAFTPTGSWSTNTTYTGFKRRVGDELECQVYVALAGAPTSAPLSINIPDSLVIDTAKLGNTAQYSQRIPGHALLRDNGINNFRGVFEYNGTTSVELWYEGAGGIEANVSQAAPFTFASGDSISMYFRVPISTWSAKTEQVVNALENVPPVRYSRSTTQSITSSTITIIDFATVNFDRDSLVTTGAAWKYTASSAGKFKVSAAAAFTAVTGWGLIEQNHFYLYKNGSLYSYLDLYIVPTGDASAQVLEIHLRGDDLIDLAKDDYIDIRIQQTSGGAINLQADATKTYVNIEKVDQNAILGQFPLPLVGYIKDVKSNSTDGGTFTAGAERTRDLNTTSGDFDLFGSLAANVFTLQPGKYIIECAASSYQVNKVVHWLYQSAATNGIMLDTSGNQVVSSGTVTGSSYVVGSNDLIIATFSISTSTAFEIRGYCQTTGTTTGFGVNASSTNTNVSSIYTQVKLTKVR